MILYAPNELSDFRRAPLKLYRFFTDALHVLGLKESWRLPGDCMKSENWTRMVRVPVAGVCLAMLIFTYGALAQETQSRVTVNDVERTYRVRLPRVTMTHRSIRW